MGILTHTGGPWRVRASWNKTDVLSGFGFVLARVQPIDSLANARLIAAAPDLLDACKLAVAAMGDMDAANAVRDAISRAEGRPA